jgi:hypothetical protein
MATPGAIRAFAKTDELILNYVDQHANLERGTLDDEDHRLNQRAVKEGGRIFSAFQLNDKTKIWVITEADREVTTVLLPSDY